MPLPFIIQLKDCADSALVGGKAAGLGALIRHGFRVPSGFCMTTDTYRDALHDAGIDAARRWKQALDGTGVEQGPAAG